MNEVVIDVTLNKKSFENQIKDVEDRLKVIDKQLAAPKTFGLDERDIEELNLEAEKLNNQLIKLRGNQDKINNTGLNAMKSNLKDIGNSIEGVIKKVSRWALAVIGIRSAYMGIRRAISLVASENENISGQINIMKSVIANALAPVVQQILNLVAKLMVYINYIFTQLTGRPLFDFAKAWKNANKNSGATAKNVKEINKQLAGFDEMNVLSKSSSSGGVGGVSSSIGQIANPFAGMEDMATPKWLEDIVFIGKWIKDNWLEVIGLLSLTKMVIDLISGNWFGAVVDAVIFLASQIPRLVDAFKAMQPAILAIIKALLASVTSLLELAVNTIVGVITMAVQYIKNPFVVLKDTIVGIFNGLKKSVQGIFDVIKGLFTADLQKVMDGMKKIVKGAFDSLWTIIKAPINLVIGAINAIIKGLNKISFDVPDWVPLIGGKKWGFNIPTIPKLAKGGIINMPGRGVPVGGAYVGERAAEGVIPLTDSQQMALLGEAIGKYININATVPVYVGNRQIAREIKKINAESDFAFNR